MRKNLIQARKSKGLTQEKVANHLKMLPTSYQKIEYGERGTNTENWDSLEDLLGVSQRLLRKII